MNRASVTYVKRFLDGRRVAYGAALLIGLAVAASVFPAWAWLGRLPPTVPDVVDFAQHVIGQRYFLQQPWSWPLLVVQRLDATHGGTNIAFTDSIPLFAILAKLVQPIAPWLRQSVTIYQVLAWTLQPVAAVFALRSAGERRVIPALAIAVLAISMPTFVARLWHAALDGHAFLLLELGLVLRAGYGPGVAASERALVAAAVLPMLLLLIHPYLMLMAWAILASAPLTRVIRRMPAHRAVVAAMGSLAAVALLAKLLGYGGQPSPGGFGDFSMNLASPFWPLGSSILPGVSGRPVDATGDEFEGYQYLGAGLLVLIVFVLARRGSRALVIHAILRGSPGLALCCAALTLLALSNRIYLFHVPVLLVRLPADALNQVRASGRFFWPAAYAVLIAAVAATARSRLGLPLLIAASVLQFLDAVHWRAVDREGFRFPPLRLEMARLESVLAARTHLDLLPIFPCAVGPAFMEALWLGAGHAMWTNTVYVARGNRDTGCIEPATLEAPVMPDEVRIVETALGATVAAMAEGHRDCRSLGPYAVCTASAAGLVGLPPPPPAPLLPLGTWLPTGAAHPAADALAGWLAPGRDTTSSYGGDVWIAFRIEPPLDAGLLGVRVTLRLRTNAPRPDAPRVVAVEAAGHALTVWTVDALAADDSVLLPGPLLRDGTVRLRLRTFGPKRAISQDPWLTGISITALRIDPAL